MNSTLLVLSCIAILGPTALTMGGNESRLGELGFSRVTSVCLLVMYFAFLYFQVCT
jgi:Ca2+/H+ antiporter